MTHRNKSLLALQYLLLGAGTFLLTVYVVALVHHAISSKAALSEFDRGIERRIHTNVQTPTVSTSDSASGASEVRPVSSTSSSTPSGVLGRTADKTDKIDEDAAIAVLRFPRLGVRVPVFGNTSHLALNSGAGWIAGTSRPGEAGNIGIAGHRDGVFRILRKLSTGDSIELSTATTVATYSLDQTVVVNPSNTEVLRQRAMPSLTLVTCYPFNYIGPAPKRYILYATLQNTTHTSDARDGLEHPKSNE